MNIVAKHSVAEGPVALSSHHLEELQASAITPDTIEARGYRSVKEPDQLPPEFKGAQRSLTGLVIPVRDVTGAVVFHQLKPDQPRIDERGRVCKYEWPAGVKLRLDVPQAALPYLRDSSTPLWITEGSKKVDSAVSNGISTIIGVPGVWGWLSNGAVLPDWHEIELLGREVIIAFDSDVMTKDSVREAIERLADYLELRGAAVRYCLLPSLPSGDKCGLDDWFAAGHSLDQLSDVIVQSLPGPIAGWEAPLPVPTLEGPAFPHNVFPEMVEHFVNAVAEETQTPRDLAAIVALGTLSAAVAGKYVVQPLPEISWKEAAHLYVVAVAHSGVRKSSVFGRMTEPVFAYEREQQEAARPLLGEWQSRERALSNGLRVAEQAASKATAKGGRISDEDAMRMAAQMELEEHQKRCPVLPRLILDDATPEAAVRHMSQQGGTIAVMSAEAAFLSNVSGQYGDKPKFDVMLKGYSGESLQTDRMGRESEYIRRACLSICLSVQPRVIADLGSVPGFEDRGAVARLLAGFIPDLRGFENLDALPVPEALELEWNRLVRTLLGHTTVTNEKGERDPRSLSLSDDAQTSFRRFREAHQKLTRPKGTLREIEAWGSRMPGQVLRIAALLHLAAHPDDDAGEIDAHAVECAVRIGEYFAVHAFTLHRLLRGNGGHTDAVDLLHYIGELGPMWSKRDLHRRVRGQSRFEKASSLNAPLSILEERLWIRRLKSPGGGRGRPSEVYEVNPALHQDNMDKTCAPNLYGLFGDVSNDDTDAFGGLNGFGAVLPTASPQSSSTLPPRDLTYCAA